MKNRLLFYVPQLTYCVRIIEYLFNCFHSKVEDYINQGKDSDNIKVKKKMLLYYVYTTIIYSLCLPIFNPFASAAQAFTAIALALCQLLMIKVQNHYLLASYFVFYTFLSIYMPVQKDDELLKAIGTALMHHNLFFLFPDNIFLKLIYTFISQSFIRGTEGRILALLDNGEIDIVRAMIRNFYYCWPLIYIVNHVNSMCLVKAFQRAMVDNKKVETKLREVNEKLIETNVKLNETMLLLEKTNEDLKDALKARELFIASASHELRNPLNAMIGNIELVRLDTKEPKMLQMLDRCKVCGDVLLALINNILDVAKINAEKLELHYQPENFLEVVEKIWNISAFKMKEKGLKGELFVSYDFPKFVEMDSHRLMQILLNLIGNSAKFTTRGFIKVIVTWHQDDTTDDLKKPHQDYLKMVQNSLQSSRKDYEIVRKLSEEIDPSNLAKFAAEGERKIDLHHESNTRAFYPKFFSHILASNYSHLSTDVLTIRKTESFKDLGSLNRHGIIKIEIIDTGCGIPQSSLDKLFRPFAQANSKITRQFGGTGLGLYITQELIKKMGGEVHVQSQEGAGSDFCVLLPAVRTTEDEIIDKIGKQSHENWNVKDIPMRALIVDDDPMSRQIFADYLKRMNVESDQAINGQEALNMFVNRKQGYYTFIITDIDMPVVNGFDFCRQIRNYEAHSGVARGVPIVVITGNCTDTGRIECLDPSGGIKAAQFYRKPFTFKDCYTCVQGIIKKQKSPTTPRRMKVLIVDDDSFNTTVLQEYLQRKNIECDVCFNGKEALEKIYREGYGSVLMDCEMPEMDGYTATKLIKQRYPQMLVIGVTGDSSEACKRKAKAHGMNELETKPINFDKIINLLRRETSF